MQPFKLFLHDPFPKLFLSNFISKSQDDAGAGCGVLLLAGEAMQLYSFAKLVNKISFWWFDKTSFIFQLLFWIEYEVIYIE